MLLAHPELEAQHTCYYLINMEKKSQHNHNKLTNKGQRKTLRPCARKYDENEVLVIHSFILFKSDKLDPYTHSHDTKNRREKI